MKTLEKNEYQEQAEKFCKKNNVEIISEFEGYRKYFSEDKEKRDVYTITIKRPVKKDWSFTFGQCLANSNKGRGNKYKPTNYDILACLTKNDPESFEDFCGNFGYDSDSVKAQKIYFDVQKEFYNCQKMFGDCMDELQEIQ